MSGLLLKNVNKIYPGGQQAIRDFNLEIKDHEFLVLSGPDGCGKSTLLRMIAGLEEITSGSLYIDGVDMTHAEPRERNVAMIFRNSILYPHMSVRENLTFALKMAKTSQEEIEKRVIETAEILNLEKILDKLPDELTTLETYQALIGRALMRRPMILLMDSTIADLDEELQAEVRQEFLNIHKRMNVTVIYVTENQKSAMTLGSRLVVMDDGEICQDDIPEKVVERPVSGYVAGVVGYPPMNFFVASVYEEDGNVGLNFKKGKILLPEEKGKALVDGGYLKKEVLVGVRADAMKISSEKKKNVPGLLTCKVQGMEQIYCKPVLRFIMGETSGICMAAAMPVETGSTVMLEVDSTKVQIFNRDTDKTIVY